MRKLCVITGATSGIGREVAQEMATRDFDLVIIGRNAEKGEDLKKELKSLAPDCNVDYYVADMSVIDEMKQVSARIVEEHPVVDVLINNAGGVFADFELTQDGIERTMANNHLGYYISTVMLLNALKKSDDGRIIIVSSGSHYKGKIDFDSFTANRGHSIMKSYEQSKLANVMFTYKLARLLESSGIAVNCLHPGVVKTSIGHKTGSKLFSYVWTLMSGIFGISTTKSAKTYIHLATTEDGRQHYSKYFHSGKLKRSSELSHDEALQDALWDWSEKVTGLTIRT